MATKVYFDEIWDYDKTTRIFRTSGRDTFLWVSSFENGIATVVPAYGSEIIAFSGLIAGCFEEGSNFEAELYKGFDCDLETALTGIQFKFNEVTVLVTKENAEKDKIVAEWRAGMDANAKSYRRETHMKTYRQTIDQEVLAIDESTELEFKDDEAKANWEKWVEINSNDGYCLDVVMYARRWAKYMQHLMSKHNKSLSQIADKAFHVVIDIDDISGFMYGCAVAILSQCWKYGEELRRWHNKRWGQEDSDGVVNPAVLTSM